MGDALMPVFKFTVIAVGADLQADENLTTLLDAGCDDATVGRVDDLQYLDFYREAASFGEAVLSAVNAVEKVDGVNAIGVNTNGTVSVPPAASDPAQAAINELLAFRLHSAGLNGDLRCCLLDMVRRPTEGVRRWAAQNPDRVHAGTG